MVNDAGSLRYEKLIEVVNSLYENGPEIDGRPQRPTPILDRSYAHTHVSLCYDYVLIALYRHMCIARRCRLLYPIYTYIFLRAFSALLLLPLPCPVSSISPSTRVPALHLLSNRCLILRCHHPRSINHRLGVTRINNVRLGAMATSTIHIRCNKA